MSNALQNPQSRPLIENAAVEPKEVAATTASRGANARPHSPAPQQSGPSFSYELLRHADKWIPEFVFKQLMRIGAWVSLGVMPTERRHSRDYLTVVLGRPARVIDLWRHFFGYTEMFVLRSRLAEGRPHRTLPLPSCDELKALVSSRRPALLGTFHFGNSDLLGFLLSKFGGQIHMIRLRMDSSRDTHRLENRFSKSISIIWVNDTSNLLFAVKQAAQSGQSIAMKCDRPEHSSKLEPFNFLGQRLLFPFTIYHLAILFNLPVVFCVGVPVSSDESTLHGSPVFEPNDASKAENLERGRAHFQAVLAQLEALVRSNPYLWFNFTPLMPAQPGTLHAEPAASPTQRDPREMTTPRSFTAPV